MRRRDEAYPDFSKLVWLARRRGPHGRAALEVLQDALMTHWGPQFERAMRYAETREGEVKPFVIFKTYWERLERERMKHGSSAWDYWGPFATRYGGLAPFRDERTGVIVVYDPNLKFKVRRIKKVRRISR